MALLKASAFTVDKHQIAEDIRAHKIGKRLISEAILNATKLNVHAPYLAATKAFVGGGHPGQIRTSGIKLAHKEKQIQKLRCWLKKA